MKVLITGASGQLASALAGNAPRDVQVISCSRAQLDITSESDVVAALEHHRPSVLINGAAYNEVDTAQNEGAEAALQINMIGPACLASACLRRQVRLVHFSSDYVFDGCKRTPYTEEDETGPMSVYGLSKLAGERVALEAGPSNLVIRVCTLFSPPPKRDEATVGRRGGFPLLMLRLARQRGTLRVVSDQVCNPSYTPDVAGAVWELVLKSGSGLYHLSNAGEVSFFDYAREVLSMAGLQCELIPVSSKEYGAAAQRPLYSVLSNAKAHSAGITPLRHWRDALADFLNSYQQ